MAATTEICSVTHRDRLRIWEGTGRKASGRASKRGGGGSAPARPCPAVTAPDPAADREHEQARR